MEHESSRPQPAPATPDRAHWTPAKQRVFLAALVETGSVAASARAAGMSRVSAHRLRGRLAGTPFDRTWAEALHFMPCGWRTRSGAPRRTLRRRVGVTRPLRNRGIGDASPLPR